MRFFRTPPDELRGRALRLLDDGDFSGALAAARRLGRDRPGPADLELWAEAALAAGEREEALEAAKRLALAAPADAGVRHLLGSVHMALAQWKQALAEAEVAVRLDGRSADAWALLARAARRAGDQRVSDDAFRRAHELDGSRHAQPHRVDRATFDGICGQVLDALPPEFRDHLGNTMIDVEELPPAEEVAEGLEPDVLGYYRGGTALEDGYPNRIVLYQRNHEDLCGSRAELEREVRETVLHEIGHHFGMEEYELPF
ncbi:MAG: metallopeptidase family protein [Candidatus Dormibacteria bacterium]